MKHVGNQSFFTILNCVVVQALILLYFLSLSGPAISAAPLSGTESDWTEEAPFDLNLANLENVFLRMKKEGTPESAARFDAMSKQLFLTIIRGLKNDSPAEIAHFIRFIGHVSRQSAPGVFAYARLTKYLYNKLKWDLQICRIKQKPEKVIEKIMGYSKKCLELNKYMVTCQESLAGGTANAPFEDALVANVPASETDALLRGRILSPSDWKFEKSSNTITDKVLFHTRTLFGKLKKSLGMNKKKDEQVFFTTREAADKVFDLVTEKISAACDFKVEDVPLNFIPSSNNMSEQYSQGMGFAKLKEMIQRTAQAARDGKRKGVFIIGHNFILSGENVTKKLSGVFISAREAGVPVLFSYDQFGSTVYAKGSAPYIEAMKKSGIGISLVKSMKGERMDHRKIYFFGTGDGHVTVLTGGQGWDEKYSGVSWDEMQAVSSGLACPLYSEDEEEPWLDHMRMLDGEAALQGALNFLGQFAAMTDSDTLKSALSIDEQCGAEEMTSRLNDIFFPELEFVGDTPALLLNNITWDKRPITEAWYRYMTDPDVTEIRIAMPYITDPIFRKKLKEAIRAGKNIRLLIPGTSDCFLAQYASLFLLAELDELHTNLVKEGKKVGDLELRSWHNRRGEPEMLHMKLGIFLCEAKPERSAVIDGSYNAAAIEARSTEKNADIILFGKNAVLDASQTYDDFFMRSKLITPTFMDKLKGAAPTYLIFPIF